MIRLLLVSPLFTTCTWHLTFTFHCTTLSMNSYRTAWTLAKLVFPNLCLQFWHSETSCIKSSVCLCPCCIAWPLNFLGSGVHGGDGAHPGLPLRWAWRSCLVRCSTYLGIPRLGSSKGVNYCVWLCLGAPSIITFLSDSNSSVTWLVIRCLII